MSITIGSNFYQLIENKKLSSNWWPHIPQPLPLVLFSLVKLRFIKERPMLLHSLSPLPRSSTENICKQGHQKTCHCQWTPSTWPLFLTIVYSLILWNPLVTWFPWQHTLLIPTLLPGIHLFRLIFKFFILCPFLSVWPSVIFSTTVLDKGAIIFKATVSNSPSSSSTTHTRCPPRAPFLRMLHHSLSCSCREH